MALDPRIAQHSIPAERRDTELEWWRDVLRYRAAWDLGFESMDPGRAESDTGAVGDSRDACRIRTQYRRGARVGARRRCW